jgi:hypothetical protein
MPSPRNLDAVITMPGTTRAFGWGQIGLTFSSGELGGLRARDRGRLQTGASIFSVVARRAVVVLSLI